MMVNEGYLVKEANAFICGEYWLLEEVVSGMISNELVDPGWGEFLGL